MVDYERMYKVLFNGITDAIGSLEAQNYGAAKELLMRTQQDAEEIFLEADGDERDDEVGGEPWCSAHEGRENRVLRFLGADRGAL